MSKKKSSRRNRINWPLLLSIGAGGLIGYTWLKKQVSLIQFGSISVPYQAIKSGSLVLGLRLPIINSSSISASVTGFTGVILTPGGTVIGTVFMSGAGKIPAYQQAVLSFTATLRLTDIIAEAGTQVLSGSFPTDWSGIQKYLKGYLLSGQVRIYGVPVPIKMPLI